jgi:ParB-like chromosome segregation protein Spo0J
MSLAPIPKQGLTGLNQVEGYIYEEFLPQLKGIHAARVYREMSDNDPIVSTMLYAIDMFMRRAKWSVQPAGEDKKSEEDAKFLEECRSDMSMTWPEFIAEVNTMLTFGWSYFEILYKRRFKTTNADGNAQSKYDDGKIGWRKFDPRSQESLDRWVFDDSDYSLKGMVQRPAPTYDERYIPIGKSLLFRTTSRKNNPEGRSVLRAAYRPWYFKKRIEEIEGIGIERDLAGLPFAEIPARMMGKNASEEDKAMVQSIRTLIANVRRDQLEGIVWPQDWDEGGNPQYTFKLMNSGGSRQFSTDQTITRYEQRIAMTVLADFILLGNDSSGSFALSTSKSGMFQASLTAWMDIIKDVLNNYAIPRLFRLNGVEGPYPQFAYEPVQKPSLADLATFVAALAGAGAQLFPDTNLENYFRDLAGMPLREDKEDSSDSEQELRTQTLAAQIEMQRQQQKQAAIDPAEQLKQQQAMQQQQIDLKQQKPLGKDPQSTPGAPTKTTGEVKSKLPPQERRRTAAVNAAENVTKLDLGGHQQKVKNYLAENYPKSTLGWVDGAEVGAPKWVSLSDIQMSRRPGGRDFEKVKGIAGAIRGGKRMDPVVLVSTPGGGKLKVADGYHRTLAHDHAGEDKVRAYVANVDDDHGPWDREMHDKKLNKRLSDAQKSSYEMETDRIKAAKERPENQRPHEFKAAQWTHKNGHPRCTRCGDEEPIGGMCTP